MLITPYLKVPKLPGAFKIKNRLGHFSSDQSKSTLHLLQRGLPTLVGV